jgi:CBS-domain-containing membrane protein
MFALGEIMTTNVITVSLSTTLAEARSTMKEHRIRHLPVLNEGGEMVGLLTQSDVLAAADSILRDAENRIPAREISIKDVMVTKIATVDENASLRQAALFLEKHRIGCLPVVTEDKLVGIITDTDFVGVAINLLEQLEELEPIEEEHEELEPVEEELEATQ